MFEGFKFEYVDVAERDAARTARRRRATGVSRAIIRSVACRGADGAETAPPQTLETGTPTTNKPVLAVIGWSPYGAPWLQLVAICGKSESPKRA